MLFIRSTGWLPEGCDRLIEQTEREGSISGPRNGNCGFRTDLNIALDLGRLSWRQFPLPCFGSPVI